MGEVVEIWHQLSPLVHSIRELKGDLASCIESVDELDGREEDWGALAKPRAEEQSFGLMPVFTLIWLFPGRSQEKEPFREKCC
ncbi:MAG TPA: hypothetical protein V6D30_00345 [Leptolyngbyaceae cyanobacterium]